MRIGRRRAAGSGPGIGDAGDLAALEDLGYLSGRPGPDDAIEANGRYVLVAGRVMFVAANVNHATALTQSGLAASPDTVVGYDSAARPGPAAPWRFISVDHRFLGGSRVVPTAASAKAAAAAFEASGFGDVSKAMR